MKRVLGGRKGQTFIEAAFVIVPIMATFLLIMEVSTVVFLKAVFQNAVREGVRFGITFSTSLNGNACSTQTACIKQVVASNSLGFISPTSSYVNVKYYAPFDLSNPLTGPVGAVTSGPNQHGSIDFINQTGNIIEVNIASFPWSWMAPLPGYAPGSGLTLSASASDVLQGYPAGSFSPPAP